MRVLSTELTNALESGNYIPYYRVELGDGVHWYESREPISYRLDPLSMRVRFPISEPLGSGYAVSEIPYARLVRGVLIGETAYTISTSQFYITAANWDGDATIEASIVPVQKYTADGDVSYSSVISAFCSAYGFTAVFENPSADWWGYQFLPDGKQIILNDANRFFSLLRQKYLIFACDNGGNEIKFFHIASLFPTSMYTLPSASLQMADLFFEKRQYLWRDELGTIHNSGDPVFPVHNLGYLPSTAIPPSVESDLGKCKIVSSMHLKLQTGDTASFVYRSGSLHLVVPIRWLNVVEELDRSKSLPWKCVLSPIDYFSNTEGGAMPSTIERVAAYTPLVSVNFDGNLTPAVNNLQALAEAVDDLPLGDIAPATTAANDVQVGNGAGAWVKKTLAEFVTILRTVLDSVYAAYSHTHSSYITDASADGNYYGRRNSAWSNLASVYAAYSHTHEQSSYINGCKLEWVSSTSIKINAGVLETESGDRIEISSITKSSLSLSASTMYHVYVYLSGGSATAEVVTTAPASPYAGTARSKTGATGRRYVGSIVTDSSGNVKPFEHIPEAGYFGYKKFGANSSPHRALNGGTATSATSVSLSSLLPTTAKMAQVRLTNSSDVSASTSDDNGVGASQITAFLTAGNTARQSGFLLHPTDSSQRIWYVMTSSPSTGGLYIDVHGYYFDR